MKFRAFLLTGAASIAVASPAFAGENQFLARLAAMPRMTAATPSPAAVAPAPAPVAAPAPTGSVTPTTARHPAPRNVHIARHDNKPVAAPVTPPPSVSALEAKIAEQQAQLAALTNRIDSLGTAPEKPAAAPAKPEAPPPVVAMSNARPTITSGDGKFSIAIRALAQFDAAYYNQAARAQQLAAANGPDLSSGQNFRRAHLGIQGKAFGDWGYQFNYDFGGSSGTESPGRIQAAYIEYLGLAPWTVRIGAFPASASIEDNTSAAETLFLERNAPAELARNIAGGDGRDGISVIYATDRVYGALSYTGNKIADSGSFDEQQALVGRLSGVVVSTDTAKAIVSANGTYVFRVADSAAGAGAPGNFSLSASPELTVDNTGGKLVNTGTLNARSVFQWGLETAAQWKSFYGQAGYFGFNVAQRAGGPNVSFGGWYAQASWIVTGENRGYNVASGAFTSPKPAKNFAFDGSGWGAIEVAARYSALNLNDNQGVVGAPMPAGGVRGGEQRIATLGVNWYPNSMVRFELQFQHVQVDRIGTIPAGFGHGVLTNVGVGQSFNTIALRSQISF